MHSDDAAQKRTKIVATIGPASGSPDVLRRLIQAGVDVFRLNFSHGTHEGHSEVLAGIRSVSAELHRHVAVLQDLCGPKIRLGPIPGDVVDCALDTVFTLVTERSSDDPRELTCSYRDLPNDLNKGETVLLADGTVAMEVVETNPGRATLKVTLPGRLRSRQGLNLPGSKLAVESLTPKDLADLDWTARHAGDVDFVGLSFARSADDVRRLRHELEERACPARIVVKIEKPEAVANIESIVAATDGVMVARGDMGVELSVERVPAIQKRIIALCREARRPVITATQMLGSMETSSRPTRAEASDVFNAVVDGTDAVMLSAESAVGEYPVEAVQTMRRICVEAETWMKSQKPSVRDAATPTDSTEASRAATVEAAHLAIERLDAPLVVVATHSGHTALALSARRPAAAAVVLARSEPVARALALCWGVTPLVVPDGSTPEQELVLAIDWARSQGLVSSGQHAVLLREDGEQPTRMAVLVGEVQ
jgi:pyruvate kinase